MKVVQAAFQLTHGVFREIFGHETSALSIAETEFSRNS
jgi:hypothetical protein